MINQLSPTASYDFRTVSPPTADEMDVKLDMIKAVVNAIKALKHNKATGIDLVN